MTDDTTLTPKQIRSVLFHGRLETFDGRAEDCLLEQYKLYVEMTDRISARRISTNTFFAAVNTLVIAAASLVPASLGGASLMFIGTVGTLLCFAWHEIVTSYRNLSAGKFRIINLMEEKLSAAPFHAEWATLGEGKKRAVYRPVTYVENWVAMIFIIVYVTFVGLGLYRILDPCL